MGAMSVQSVEKDESESGSKTEMTEEERLLASIPEEHRDELSSTEVEQPVSPSGAAEPTPTPGGEPELDTEPESDFEDAGDVDEEGEAETEPEAETETEKEPEPEEDPTEAEDESEAESAEDNEGSDDEESTQSPHGRNLPLRSGSMSLPARVYGSFINNMSTFHDEGRLVISDSGINMAAPDKSNVAMTDATLNTEAFESFTAPETELGISLEKTQDALNVFSADSEITLSHDGEEHQQTLADGDLRFNFSLIGLDYIDTPADIPDFAYAVTFTISTAEFKRLIKAADMVGDSLVFTANEDTQTVKLSAEGDTDEVDKSFGPDDIDIDKIANSVSIYSLDYLKPIQKTMKGVDEINISFSENYPIRISFEQHDGALETEYLVAPKIPSDS